MSAPQKLLPLGDRTPLRHYLRQLWARREFATAIAVGDIRSQNMDTVLGNLWHIMNPLMLLGVYYLIFGVLVDISRGMDNFPAFLAIGIFAYYYSQKSIIAGSKSVVANVGLIRSIQFPRAILPLATVIGQTVSYLPAIFVALLFAAATGERPRLAWLLVFAVMGLQALFNTGMTFIAARLADRFHDIQNLLPYLFRLAFYLSGILYSVDRFVDDERLLALFDLNPFYAFVTLARAPVLSDEITVSTSVVVSAVVWGVGSLVAGFLFFRAGEREYGRG